MNLADACVYPYPTGNSSVRRMALKARTLGFDGIVAAGSGQAGEYRGITIIDAVLIEEPEIKNLISALKRVSRDTQVVLVNAGNNTFNRTAITQRKVTVLRHVHKGDRDAFDHVTARMAAERGVAVDLDIRPLIQLRGSSRQNVIRKYADLLALQRKFGFPFTLSSGAFSVLEQRSVRDLVLLASLFGMTEPEVHTALGTIGRILEGDVRVREVV